VIAGAASYLRYLEMAAMKRNAQSLESMATRALWRSELLDRFATRSQRELPQKIHGRKSEAFLTGTIWFKTIKSACAFKDADIATRGPYDSRPSQASQRNRTPWSESGRVRSRCFDHILEGAEVSSLQRFCKDPAGTLILTSWPEHKTHAAQLDDYRSA
jgi:hypothetical protein